LYLLRAFGSVAVAKETTVDSGICSPLAVVM